MWIDSTGASNHGSWPECLKSTTEMHFRFQVREVTVDDIGMTEVVAIDCRATHPLMDSSGL